MFHPGILQKAVLLYMTQLGDVYEFVVTAATEQKTNLRFTAKFRV